MKKWKLTIIMLSMIISSYLPCSANAEEGVAIEEGRQEYVEMEPLHKGFFAGIGPMIGFETNALKTVGGGAASQLGYRFNNRFTILLQADMYYTRDRGVDYLFFPVFPTIKLTFDSNFFAFIGGGYTFLWASNGPKFGRNVSTGSRSYNGWGIFGGGGYDIWWNNKFLISPQVGLDYTRIGSSNIIIPIARVHCSWMF